MQTPTKRILSLLVAIAAAAAFAPSIARADSVTVSTSGGATTDTIWTVSDPQAGNYTVTVSGANRSTATDGFNYYRNSSNSSTTVDDDRTITYTISGLNPAYAISGFSLGTTKIVPGQGSGSGWNYTTTLSGTDLSTASSVTSSQTFAGVAGPINPPMSVTGDFGNAPAFTLFIDESTPLTSRTIGTRDFTITASPLAVVPEPASLALLAFGGVVLLARRRK